MAASDQDIKLMEAGAAEIARLTSQHLVFKDHLGGKLVWAPLDVSRGGFRILDQATADGLWLRDLAASTAASNTYIGTDIVPQYLATNLPPGMSLHLQNMTEPWRPAWKHSFDLVHSRLCLAAAAKRPLREVIMGMVDLVKPGGWIQIEEIDYTAELRNGPIVRDFLALIEEVIAAAGIGRAFVQRIPGWLAEAGFEECQEHVFHLRYGAKNPKPDMARMSARSLTDTAAGIVAATQFYPTDSLTPAQLESLPRDLEKELIEKGGNVDLMMICARRPNK